MADDKKTQLSIILRTVDRATAGIKAVNDRLDAMTKPIRDFRKELGNLREKSGLDDVVGGFKGVTGAIGDLLSEVALIGGVVGGAVAAVFHLVGEFDDLGDKAERFGVSVEFLASMRYAAEKAGAPVEALDSGLQAMSQSLGQLRAGTGRMKSFLDKVSPALERQLKGAKSNEEAFYLLAAAMDKIKDPAKRAALAQKTLGDSALAPLLAQGEQGIKKLAARYAELAPGMGDAAEKAGAVDDSLHDLKAASDGAKAALISGLAPALKIIVDRLRDWLVGHREDIKQWAAWLGERLPGAVASLVEGIKGAITKIGHFIDAIGGWKTVALGLAAVILGPLIGAVASFGVALMSTPVGWAIGLIAGVVALKEAWDNVSDSVREYASLGPLIERMNNLLMKSPEDAKREVTTNVVQAFASNSDAGMRSFFEGVNTGKDKVGGANSAFYSAIDAVRNQAGGQSTEAKIKIDISGAPPGTRVTTDPKSTADVDLTTGYQFMGFGS